MLLMAVATAWGLPAQAQRFYPDDPLWKEPPPHDTVDPQPKSLSGLLEYFSNTFGRPGERQPEQGVIPAQNVNTLGGVPDSPWFINRHGRNPMTLDELVAGPGSDDPPREDGPWRVLTVKPDGDRTGMLVADADNTIYLLRFDPRQSLELQTGTEMVSSKFYYAAGYNVLENYLVYFERDKLEIQPGAEQVTSFAQLRDLVPEQIDEFLESVARDPERGYRAVATRAPDTTIFGNYQFYGTRNDDPNDIVPHEHRRDLRGLWVLHAWLGNSQFNPANTLEALASEDGVQFIRRYIVDFFKTLGAGVDGPKEARDGHDYRFNLDAALRNVATMGVVGPDWATASYPGLASIGRIEGEVFDADEWKADTHFATWANRLPDDLYWGAQLVMSFSDEQIRAIVNTGQYSDARATQWIADALIKRRDEIGRDFLTKVLPLDNFRVVDDRLEFDDLIALYGLGPPHAIEIDWNTFDNIGEQTTFILSDQADPYALPVEVLEGAEGEYFAVNIRAVATPGMNVIVYLRKTGGFEVVGVERNWPGKIVVEPGAELLEAAGFSRYASLDDRRKSLLDPPARVYNAATGRNLTTQEWFDTVLTLSERTTFDAITHALLGTRLTNSEGEDLGTALDLISGVERVAGQYSGRSGDEQFRLYVTLVPNAEDVLRRSTQFQFGHENTVYHVGYPRSYRQEGDVPNMQISVSDDGLRGDIDVDYRSSSSPQALFNGHLTSSNSDVRAGDNVDKHNGRWSGLVNWWQSTFGDVQFRKSLSNTELMARAAAELPTPLPPDRPLGAAPDQLHEAAQEFLTDWIVRGKIDEAMRFLSPRAIACINIDDSSEAELLSRQDAIVAMREIMSYALEQLPDRDNLTEAIDEFAAQNEDQARRIETHPFAGDFTIMQVRNRVAADYTCSTQRGGEPPPMPGGPDAVGTYFAVLFRVKARDDQGGVIGLLWDRLDGSWKISSYAVIQY